MKQNFLQTLRRRWMLCKLIVGMGVLLAIQASSQPLDWKQLETYVEASRKAWEIPGLAIAIVQNDSLIYAKGFGVRALGKPEKVDPHTLFAVASNTKAFTAALLGMLVDEGKLSWDDRVIDHLRDFQMYDPYVTRDIRIRDLLCHRSGLPTFGGDHLWIGSPLTRKEVVRRIRYLKPNAPFRTKFQYQNLMFVTAGEIIPAVTGKSWEDFLQERILAPLGMRESTTSMAVLHQRENVATPHERVQGRIQAVPYDPTDNTAPAGALKSNVLDMSRWMRLNLARGTFHGRRFFSEAVAREMQSVQMPIQVSEFDRKMYGRHFRGYGLGWGLFDYKGYKIVSHGGGLSGMFSLQTLVPEKHFGVIILTNFAPHSLTPALTYWILDRVLGGPTRDWSAEFLKLRDKQRRAAQKREAEIQKQRIPGTRPSLPLKDYVGTYSNPLSGKATIRLVNGKLVFYYNSRHTGPLEHWHYDTFRITWENPIYDMPKKAFLTFYLDEQGKVEKLRTTFYHPIEFKKVSTVKEAQGK